MLSEPLVTELIDETLVDVDKVSAVEDVVDHV